MVLEVETKMCTKVNISLAEQIIGTRMKHQQVGTNYKLILTQMSGQHQQLAYFS